MRLLVFVACVGACLVGHAAIVLAAARKQSANAVPGVPRPNRGLELLWALLPALVLALVLTATWNRVRQADDPHHAHEIMKVAR